MHGMGKLKALKPPMPTMSSIFPHRTPQTSGVTTYHQALTANILQSLSDNSGCPTAGPSKPYDLSPRYDALASVYGDNRILK